jgi:hypothetical protein
MAWDQKRFLMLWGPAPRAVSLLCHWMGQGGGPVAGALRCDGRGGRGPGAVVLLSSVRGGAGRRHCVTAAVAW